MRARAAARPLFSRRAGVLDRPRPPARPWQVAALVGVVYAILLGAQIRATGITSFIRIGSNFTTRSVSPAHRSAAIAGLHPSVQVGYDGQFVYYIALDPLRARWYIDDSGYRYGRILYPVTAWLVALGQPGALPYSMLAVNLAAVVGTVFLLGGFLRRRSLSPWWAAVYGFFPGIICCLWVDLTEPLAFFLATLGFVMVDRRPTHALRAAPIFALALLARETTIVFPIMVSLQLALRGRSGLRPASAALRRAALFTLVWLTPPVVYRVLIGLWLGFPQERAFERRPFYGLDLYWPFNADHILIVLTVVIPALVWLALALVAWRTVSLTLPAAILILSVVWFVIFLPTAIYGDYLSAGRASTPIVLAAVLFLPALRTLPRPHPRAVSAAVLLLTPAWMLVAMLLTGTPSP